MANFWTQPDQWFYVIFEWSRMTGGFQLMQIMSLLNRWCVCTLMLWQYFSWSFQFYSDFPCHTVTVGLRSYQMPVSFNPSRIWFGHKVPDPWMIWSNVTIMGWKTFLEYARYYLQDFLGIETCLSSFGWHDVVEKSIRN